MNAGKRVLALLLGVTLLLGVLSLPVGAAGPGYEVDVRPNIILHGIGQSEVFLYDEATGERVQKEDGSYVQGWPPALDFMTVLPDLLLPLIGTLLFQFDFGLSDAIQKAAATLFSTFEMDEDGMPVNNMQVMRYPKSMAETDQAGKDFVFKSFPLQGLRDLVGDENIYYFAYDSFGNNAAITEELYAFIQGIKAEKGVDKVNLIPVSLGGTLMNSLLETHPDVIGDLYNVVYIIPALDGSRIVGDLYLGNLSTSNEELYRYMIPSLMEGEYLGYLLNLVIRLLPKRVVEGVLNGVLEGVVGEVLSYSTTMWSLVPSGDYEKARERWLNDSAHDKIRAQTDAYWKAQKNSRKNIQAMVDAGVHVYNIVDYDCPLYAIAGSYKDQNADGVIHTDSTSMGGKIANVGQTLPEGYKQAVTNCGHNHLSPDGMVDASTGTLPETTFYMKGQNHESTGRNDVIMLLTIRLATAANQETVFSIPEFPQFNYARDTRGLRTGTLPDAKKVDTSTLSPQDKAALESAIAEVEQILADTRVVPGQIEAADARLHAVLVKIGVRSAPEPDYTAMILEPVTWFLSEVFYYLWGPRGFGDSIFSIWYNIDLT